MHTQHFSADPHAVYEAMRRQFGPVVPVELAPGVPATLVIGYHTAVEVLYDPRFPADPQTWQESMPEGHPLLGMLAYQDAARYNNVGPVHDRYRGASKYSLAEVNLHALRAMVEQIAGDLVESFAHDIARATDRCADALSRYASPLVLTSLNWIIGCPPELGDEVARGMAARFDSTGRDGGGMRRIWEALMALTAHKRVESGNDVTSRLICHESGLDDREVVAQLMSFYGAGYEAQRNLITNAILRILTTTSGFGGGVMSGTVSTRDALDKVLFEDPPIANFCASYPTRSILLHDTWLQAHQPVLISLAGCNNDPAIAGGDLTGNRSHLAWGLGPHACPAKDVAYLVVETAIDQLFDALPELRLAVPEDELTWRPGPFHRALSALPLTLPD